MADRTCNSACMQPVWDLPLTSAGIVIQLENGGRVRIRPARPSDDDGIKAGFARLSEESRYNRFFNARSQLSDSLATSLTDIDHTNHFAWGVFDPDQPSEVGDESGFGVAAARLIRDKGSTSAEAALTVTDDYQGRGIGRFLMELLVATAADVGTDILRFEILRQNRPMISLAAGMGAEGFPIEGERSVVEYRLAVPAPSTAAVPAGALYELLRHAAHSGDEPEH
ncbi:MAG: GNAT superfamily N-acetyltransferase [Acidimicrobiales bacterium]|jgi:GNAT superfamily N-acetyltransferase